ncbi:hypothetical protein GCM10025868_31800 [Angustibacter aerolatus]|uniref:Uncharacterized protein n=1 Tax=Angustibacter aerolatus TaxID=1162965 RepID=A0ABQ6JI75_9ACTN|nr:hypothetical protein GCM10025868_31800 [Angustibacter aerolatus]
MRRSCTVSTSGSRCRRSAPVQAVRLGGRERVEAEVQVHQVDLVGVLLDPRGREGGRATRPERPGVGHAVDHRVAVHRFEHVLDVRVLARNRQHPEALAVPGVRRGGAQAITASTTFFRAFGDDGERGADSRRLEHPGADLLQAACG